MKKLEIKKLNHLFFLLGEFNMAENCKTANQTV